MQKNNSPLQYLDGTVTSIDSSKITKKIKDKVKELQKDNQVVICSNTFDKKRAKEIAETLKIEQYNKSDIKPLLVPESHYKLNHKNFCVIGDLYLTDGIFANRINAKFIKVKRITSKDHTIVAAISLGRDIIDFAFELVLKHLVPQKKK